MSPGSTVQSAGAGGGGGVIEGRGSVRQPGHEIVSCLLPYFITQRVSWFAIAGLDEQLHHCQPHVSWSIPRRIRASGMCTYMAVLIRFDANPGIKVLCGWSAPDPHLILYY